MNNTTTLTAKAVVPLNPHKAGIEIKDEIVLMSKDDGISATDVCSVLAALDVGGPALIEAETLALLGKLATRSLTEFAF